MRFGFSFSRCSVRLIHLPFLVACVLFILMTLQHVTVSAEQLESRDRLASCRHQKIEIRSRSPVGILSFRSPLDMVDLEHYRISLRAPCAFIPQQLESAFLMALSSVIGILSDFTPRLLSSHRRDGSCDDYYDPSCSRSRPLRRNTPRIQCI